MCRRILCLGRTQHFGIATLVLASLFCAGMVAAQTATSSVLTKDAGNVAGEPVLIVGQGFGANESVDLDVVHVDGTAEPGMGHGPWTVVASPVGTFVSL